MNSGSVSEFRNANHYDITPYDPYDVQVLTYIRMSTSHSKTMFASYDAVLKAEEFWNNILWIRVNTLLFSSCYKHTSYSLNLILIFSTMNVERAVKVSDFSGGTSRHPNLVMWNTDKFKNFGLLPWWSSAPVACEYIKTQYHLLTRDRISGL